MKIYRNGKEIELTEDEVFAAYQEQKHIFDIENIKQNMSSFLEEDELKILQDNRDFVEAMADGVREYMDEGYHFDYALGAAFDEIKDDYLVKTCRVSSLDTIIESASHRASESLSPVENRMPAERSSRV